MLLSLVYLAIRRLLRLLTAGLGCPAGPQPGD